MKISIGSFAYLHSEQREEGIQRMKRHGYTAMDYQRFFHPDEPLYDAGDAEFEEAVLADKAAIEAAGIEIFQIHGPWRYPPQDGEEADRQEWFGKMCRAIHGAALLGAKYFVVHPLMPFGIWKDQEPHQEELIRINVDFFRRLCDVAEKEGVVICLENMPFTYFPISTPEDILALVKEINHPAMRVCLDTGHCVVKGVELGDAVRLFGKEYLRVLHVHDNDGRNDQHRFPFYGKGDWDGFAAALKEIGYEGTLSLECRVSDRVPAEIREHHEIGLFMLARELAKKCE